METAVDDFRFEQRAADSEQHSNDAGDHAASGGRDGAEPFERENETRGGRHVDEVDGVFAHGCFRSVFLNIRSIR